MVRCPGNTLYIKSVEGVWPDGVYDESLIVKTTYSIPMKKISQECRPACVMFFKIEIVI